MHFVFLFKEISTPTDRSSDLDIQTALYKWKYKITCDSDVTREKLLKKTKHQFCRLKLFASRSPISASIAITVLQHWAYHGRLKSSVMDCIDSFQESSFEN